VRRFAFAILGALLLVAVTTTKPAVGQGSPAGGAEQRAATSSEDGMKQGSGLELPVRKLPPELEITKEAEVTIDGRRVPYRVTTGTQPVYGEDGLLRKHVGRVHHPLAERQDSPES
jgi:hypothetical protein